MLLRRKSIAVYTFYHTGLEWDLYKNLYGQHLVQDIVSESVTSFLQKQSPDRPLVLSFHGASGTGKSMVSAMLARHLYGTSMGSPYIHQYVPTLHFPLANRVKQYKVRVFLLLLDLFLHVSWIHIKSVYSKTKLYGHLTLN